MSFPSLWRSFQQSNSCTQTFLRRTPRYAAQNSFLYLHIHLHRQRQELAGWPNEIIERWTDRQRTQTIVIETMHYLQTRAESSAESAADINDLHAPHTTRTSAHISSSSASSAHLHSLAAAAPALSIRHRAGEGQRHHRHVHGDFGPWHGDAAQHELHFGPPMQ